MKNNICVKSFLFITIFMVLVIQITGLAEESVQKKKSQLVPAITSIIKIDGVMKPKEWEGALKLELDNEVELPEKTNRNPVIKTEILLAYDSIYLYAAIRAYDPEPEKIRTRHNERDNIWKDDYVGITLDVFNNGQRAYNFYSNANGIQADEIYTVKEYLPWDGTWNSAGKIDDKGYVVEMAIPFSTLPLKGKNEQVWGIDAVRIYTRQKEHIINLFPRDEKNECYMCQAVRIVLFKGQ